MVLQKDFLKLIPYYLYKIKIDKKQEERLILIDEEDSEENWIMYSTGFDYIAS